MRFAAAVYSEWDGIFTLKAERRRLVKAFPGVDVHMLSNVLFPNWIRE